MPFENIVGKAENAGNQHFLLLPQCLLSFPKPISIDVCKCFQFGPVQKLSFGKELQVIGSLHKANFSMKATIADLGQNLYNVGSI